MHRPTLHHELRIVDLESIVVEDLQLQGVLRLLGNSLEQTFDGGQTTTFASAAL